MMQRLAIAGGTPVFSGDRPMTSYVPTWPIPYPETETKLIAAYRSGVWGFHGPYVHKLSTEFAAAQGAEYSVWMSNGTTTLECSLLALGVGPGDEVIVPGVTWIATATAPLYCGATPVLVDIDPETLCIDPAKIEEAITSRTKAIIPVHLFSAMADMDKIMAIARKHHLFVVEDCAHAHGGAQHGRGAGSIGNTGSFSFQLSKLMTAGEGGCVTTNDEELYDRIFRLSHIGNSPLHPGTKTDPSLLCHQYRITEFQAVIIYDQLQHLRELSARRKAGAERLNGLLRDIPGIRMQRSSYPDDVRAYYFPTLLLDPAGLKPGIDRETVMAALNAEGLSFNIGWGFPLYKTVAWNIPENRYVRKNTPVCEEVMLKQLLVFGHVQLLAAPEVIERIAEAIRKVMNAYTR